MPRVNVYLPEDLAAAVKGAGLNVSAVAQAALTDAVDALDADKWLDDVLALAPTGATHDDAMEAIDASRDEFGS